MKKVLYFALISILTLSTTTVKSQGYCDTVPIFNFPEDTVCFTGPFTVNAASSNFYDDYLWQDGDTNSSYYITAPGTYICEVADYTGNIVVNGDFEQGDTGFWSDYDDETGSPQGTASNPIGLYQEGTYGIGADPHDYHANWNSIPDHSGSGNMMIVNGSNDTTINIWCQTIDVGANTDYVFSAWLTSIYYLSPATFVFTINGDTIGDIYQHSGNVGEWDQFYVTWHSDSYQTIDICIKNQNSASDGNDFAIDDIFFGATCVQSDTIVVVPPPTASFTTSDVCSIDTMHFVNTSSANAGSITNSSWSFGDGNSSNATNPVNFYTSTNTYQVNLQVTSSFGCVDDTTIAVNINPPPSSNITTTDILCYGGSDGTATVTGLNSVAPYSFVWDNASTDATISNLGIGTYNVTVIDANGCTSTNSTTIYQPSQLVSSAIPTDVTCFGSDDGQIDFNISGGTPPYSYNWSNGAHNEDISNLSPDTYSVTVVDANGCTIQNAANITEPLEIIITPNANSILCYGDETGVIDISVTGGISPYSYNWSNLSTSEDLIDIPAGNYVVTITDNSGCTKIQAINVDQPNPLQVTLPSNFTYCNQTPEILATVEGGTTPYSYQWNTGATGSTIQYQTNNTATYSVTVTDNNGCVDQDIIEITIVDIDLEVFANKDTVCPGDPVLVTTNIIGGIAPYTIYDNGNITSFPVIVYPNGQENYTLQVVDACGNTAYAIVDIYTHPIPPLSFNADILQGCPPLTVNFNQDNYSYNFDYTWEFDDSDENNLSLDYNPTHTFEESGLYDITVQVTDSNGCKNQLTIADMIEVYPKPDAKFWVDEDVVSFIDAGIYFDNHSIDNYYNFWMFDDGDSSIFESPYHNYEVAGIYYPKLIVENEYDCRDTAIKKIEVQDEFTLYVPTAFSPDGDGINDGFIAVGHGIDLDNYFLAVYDRWGEIIWETNDLFEYWTGDAKGHGEAVQIGVYKWLVVCKDYKGVEHTKTGNVTVIR